MVSNWLQTVNYRLLLSKRSLKVFLDVYWMLFYIIRALRSRSLRDGTLPHKGRFASFVRSCSALRLKDH